jgi:hypothetical protein
MLRIGVPLPQVQSKMMTLGIDPSVLEYVILHWKRFAAPFCRCFDPRYFSELETFEYASQCLFISIFHSSNPDAPSDYDPALHGDGMRQDDSEASDDEEEDW